jgi:hypothetical protein
MSPRPLYKVADWMAETILDETLVSLPISFMTVDLVTFWMPFIRILFFRYSAERELIISGKTWFIKLFRNITYL